MRQTQQRVFDAFRRAQDFLTEHADELSTLNGLSARKELDDAVTQITAQDASKGAANLTMAGQANQGRALRTALIGEHMKPIARFARAKLRGEPGYATLTKATGGMTSRVLVGAARAMALAAQPYTTEFQQGGLPADTIQQLVSASEALDSSIADRANTMVGRMKATTTIKHFLNQGRDALGVLDAAVTKQLTTDPTLLATWQAAIRVPKKSGAVRKVKASAPVATAVASPSASSAHVANVVAPAPVAPAPVVPAPAVMAHA